MEIDEDWQDGFGEMFDDADAVAIQRLRERYMKRDMCEKCV